MKRLLSRWGPALVPVVLVFAAAIVLIDSLFVADRGALTENASVVQQNLTPPAVSRALKARVRSDTVSLPTEVPNPFRSTGPHNRSSTRRQPYRPAMRVAAPPFSLTGVMLGAKPLALVNEPRAGTRIAGTGDSIGPAVITRIGKDHIVIRYGGRIDTVFVDE